MASRTDPPQGATHYIAKAVVIVEHHQECLCGQTYIYSNGHLLYEYEMKDGSLHLALVGNSDEFTERRILVNTYKRIQECHKCFTVVKDRSVLRPYMERKWSPIDEFANQIRSPKTLPDQPRKVTPLSEF